jgi:heme exporter protein A
MLLRIEELNCSRGERQLFDNFSLAVDRGEILQIAGQNGTGKTTLLRVLCGLFEANTCAFNWQGIRVDSALQYADELVYIGHRPAVRTRLTVSENLLWLAALGGCRVDEDDMKRVLAALKLGGYEDELIFNLSAGQRRRVALTRLQLVSANLWLLDEPFNALDQDGVQLLRSWIENFVDGGGAVVLTTHQKVDFASPSFRVVELGQEQHA